MNEQKFRQKYAQSRYEIECNSPTIRELHPNILEIAIQLNFTYEGVNLVKKQIKRTFLPNDRRFFKIDCINPECVYTDLDLSEEIQSMIWNNIITRKGIKTCHGYQTYTRFLSKGEHCLTEMEYEIHIKYQ